jgi:hypothetical protein
MSRLARPIPIPPQQLSEFSGQGEYQLRSDAEQARWQADCGMACDPACGRGWYRCRAR